MMTTSTVSKHFCSVCTSGQIEIPHWFEDVESWETVTVPCPVCEGRWVLGIDEWNTRQTEIEKLYATDDDTTDGAPLTDDAAPDSGTPGGGA